MSRESIQLVREAEAEAERIVEQARARAKAMLAEATEKGKQLCSDAERDTQEAISATMLRLRERAESMNERVKGETNREAEELSRAAALRRRSAEKIVIRGLTSKCR